MSGLIPISGLPAASSVNDADIAPIVQGGVTKKATAVQIQTAGGVIPAAQLTNPLGLTTEGIISWNPEDHTINIQDDHPDSLIQAGYELSIRAVNKTGSTITNGTVVWINGAQGNRPKIEPAIATAANAGRAIGITTYDIANNAEGRIVVIGTIGSINTSSWTVGDDLYLSSTVYGALTNVAPTAAGTIQVRVGEALNSTNNGKILAKIHDFQSTALGASLTLAADAAAARTILSAPSVVETVGIRNGRSGSDKFIYDDFDRADGELNGSVTPTGDTWVVSGPGQHTTNVTDGEMGGPDNFYAYLDYGGPVPETAATFVSHDTATGGNGGVLIIASAVGDLNTMLHLQTTGTGWLLQTRLSGAWTVISGASYQLQPETVYSVSMRVVGTTVTVYPPMGDPVTTSIPALETFPTLSAAAFQGQGAKFLSVAVGRSRAERVPCSSRLAPLGEVSFLRGPRGLYKNRLTFVAPTAGFYRVATHDGSVGSATMWGTVKIAASSGPYGCYWEFSVFGNWQTGVKIVNRFFGGVFTSAQPVVVARLSRDSGSPYGTALDIQTTLDSANVTIQFDGAFDVPTPSAAIASLGASALPGESASITASW